MFVLLFQIRTENLSDPLLTLSRQRSEEDRTIMRCTTGQRYSDYDLEQVWNNAEIVTYLKY